MGTGVLLSRDRGARTGENNAQIAGSGIQDVWTTVKAAVTSLISPASRELWRTLLNVGSWGREIFN